MTLWIRFLGAKMFKKFVLILATLSIFTIPKAIVAQEFYWKYPSNYSKPAIPVYPSRIVIVPVYHPPQPQVVPIRQYPSAYRSIPVLPRRSIPPYARNGYSRIKRTRFNGSRVGFSESERMDMMEREIAEIKLILGKLTEKFDRQLNSFYSSSEYREYKRDLQKMKEIKKELLELKKLLKKLKGYSY